MSKVYVGDVGTTLKLDTTVDLSGASSVEIEAKKPDGTLVTWTGSVVETTKIQYVTASGDIDQSGTYLLQAVVTGLSGFTGRGESTLLKVFKVFQ